MMKASLMALVAVALCSATPGQAKDVILFQFEERTTGNIPNAGPPPPPRKDPEIGSVSGECKSLSGQSSVHALMSQASGGDDMSADAKGLKFTCEGSESIKLQYFSDDKCEHELNVADQMASSNGKSDWDGTLTKDWTTTSSRTVEGVTIDDQMRLVKIEGCPLVGTVGMVFIYIFAGLALCGVGGAIGVWYGKNKATIPLSQATGSYSRVQ